MQCLRRKFNSLNMANYRVVERSEGGNTKLGNVY